MFVVVMCCLFWFVLLCVMLRVMCCVCDAFVSCVALLWFDLFDLTLTMCLVWFVWCCVVRVVVVVCGVGVRFVVFGVRDIVLCCCVPVSFHLMSFSLLLVRLLDCVVMYCVALCYDVLRDVVL